MSAKAASAKPLSKSQIVAELSEKTQMSKKEVTAFLEAVQELVATNLGKKGPGVFNMPGLAKFLRVNKPATKARKGINPFTGEETMFKAKPAYNTVKIRPLKALKEVV